MYFHKDFLPKHLLRDRQKMEKELIYFGLSSMPKILKYPADKFLHLKFSLLDYFQIYEIIK